MSWLVGGLDVETTGLDQEKGHRIIEIAIGLYRTHDGVNFTQIGKGWEQRINPERSIDAKAQAVHGISLVDLKDCPKWEEVAPTVVKLLSACNLVVAHNGDGFDLPFIALELIRIGLEVPDFDTFDTMLEGRGATQMGRVPNLGALCWAMDVDYDPASAHGAFYDTDCMMQCFFTGIKRGVFEVPSMISHFEDCEAA